MVTDGQQVAEEEKSKLQDELNQLKQEHVGLRYKLASTQDDIAETQTFSQDLQSQLTKKDEVSVMNL